MIVYVIKRNDGLYLHDIYQKDDKYCWTEFLLGAYLFKYSVDAYEKSEKLRVFYNFNCKIVKVKIEEVEE